MTHDEQAATEPVDRHDATPGDAPDIAAESAPAEEAVGQSTTPDDEADPTDIPKD